MTPIPDLKARGAFDLLVGAALPFRALKLIFRSRQLFLWSLLSAAVTAGTLVGCGVVGWSAAKVLGTWLVSGEGAAWTAARVALEIVLWVAMFSVGALTAPNLVLAPLQDPLSEATEVVCGDFTPAPSSMAAVVRGTLESLKHTLARLALMLVGLVVLFPLNLVPGIGNGLWLVGSTTWSAFWLAVEHLSGPAARHLQPFGQVVKSLRSRLPLALGFGGSLTILLWVPVLNFFLVPVAVVSGTLLFRGLLGNPRS